MITDRRLQKLKKVAAQRQRMGVVLENVHDPHNIGAVLRSCDAIGIQDVFILYTDAHLTEANLDRLKSSATGVRKWLNVEVYKEASTCFAAVREKYDLVCATHLSEESKSLYELDLTQNVAFLFGNEHIGLSKAALKYADINYTIPQYGMVGSLNISVACAISLFEAGRQRQAAGKYKYVKDNPLSVEQQELFDDFISIHNTRFKK